MFSPPSQSSAVSPLAAVPSAVEAICQLSVGDRLKLLWVVYEGLEGSVIPSFTRPTGLNVPVNCLSTRVASLPRDEQLQFLHDLLNKIKTPLTCDYGALGSNAKLAFWYRLAARMRCEKTSPFLEGDRLSGPALVAQERIMALQFSQKVAVLRLIMGNMGISPF